MSDKPLTPKQEAFAQCVAKSMTLADAYRHAYSTENYAPESIWVNASKTMSDAKVSQRVAELQEAAAERTLVSIQSITKELEEARMLAKDNSQPSAAVAASMGKAKVNGLLIDKKDHTSSDGSMTPKSWRDMYPVEAGDDGDT